MGDVGGGFMGHTTWDLQAGGVIGHLPCEGVGAGL